jgi:hypothetical protein
VRVGLSGSTASASASTSRIQAPRVPGGGGPPRTPLPAARTAPTGRWRRRSRGRRHLSGLRPATHAKPPRLGVVRNPDPVEFCERDCRPWRRGFFGGGVLRSGSRSGFGGGAGTGSRIGSTTIFRCGFPIPTLHRETAPQQTRPRRVSGS